jgi:hypothetical protein
MDAPVGAGGGHRHVPADGARGLVVVSVGAEQRPDLGRVVAGGRSGVGAVARHLHVHVEAARVQVTDGEDQRPAAGGHRPAREVADLAGLLVAGDGGVGRHVVGERVEAIAVVVEAALGVEDRIELREAGDVEPDGLQRLEVGPRRDGLRHPVDLPGDPHLPAAFGGQVVDHVVDPPGLIAAELEAVALRQLPLGLLLAGPEPDPGPDPDHVMEVQVPDARRRHRTVVVDLHHAGREAGHVALGGRARGEDAGVAGAADHLGVLTGLSQRVEVEVLARMDRDRIRRAVIGRHPRVARGAEDRLGGARRGGGYQQEADHGRECAPNEARAIHDLPMIADCRCGG